MNKKPLDTDWVMKFEKVYEHDQYNDYVFSCQTEAGYKNKDRLHFMGEFEMINFRIIFN